MLTSEVILHFENTWEFDSANQDCMVDAEEFFKPKDFKKFMSVVAL